MVAEIKAREEIEGLQFMAWGSKYDDDPEKTPSSLRIAGRRSFQPAIEVQIRNDAEVERALNTFRKLMDDIVMASSGVVLKTKANRSPSYPYYVDLVTDNLQRLFDAGVAIRWLDDRSLGFYVRHHHSAGSVDAADCIGIMYRHHARYHLYLYPVAESELSPGFLEAVELAEWGPADRGWHLMIHANRGSEEIMSEYIEFLIAQANAYQPNSTLVWPSALKRRMLIQWGERDFAFFPLVSKILEGSVSSAEVENFLDSFSTREMESIMGTYVESFQAWRLESPFAVSGSEANREIGISSSFENALSAMHEEDPSFEKFTDPVCPARKLGYLYNLREAHERLKTIAPHPNGFVQYNVRLPGGVHYSLFMKVTKDESLLARMITNDPDPVTIASVQQAFEAYENPLMAGSWEKELVVDEAQVRALLRISDPGLEMLQRVEKRQEIGALFGSFLNAMESALIQPRVATQLAFWTRLESELRESGWGIREEGKFSEESIRACCQGKTATYGLLTERGDKAGVHQLISYVATTRRLFLGCGLKRDDQTDERIEDKAAELTQFIELFRGESLPLREDQSLSRSLVSAGRCNPSTPVNFYEFDEAAQNLGEREALDAYVGGIVEEITVLRGVAEWWLVLDDFLANGFASLDFEAHGVNVSEHHMVKMGGWYGREATIQCEKELGQRLFFGLYLGQDADGSPLRTSTKPELAFYMDVQSGALDALRENKSLGEAMTSLRSKGFKESLSQDSSPKREPFLWRRVPICELDSFSNEEIRKFADDTLSAISAETAIAEELL